MSATDEKISFGDAKQLISTLSDALSANKAFHTPLVKRRLGGEWDEFQADAITRTQEARSTAEWLTEVFPVLVSMLQRALQETVVYHEKRDELASDHAPWLHSARVVLHDISKRVSAMNLEREKNEFQQNKRSKHDETNSG